MKNEKLVDDILDIICKENDKSDMHIVFEDRVTLATAIAERLVEKISALEKENAELKAEMLEKILKIIDKIDIYHIEGIKTCDIAKRLKKRIKREIVEQTGIYGICVYCGKLIKRGLLTCERCGYKEDKALGKID